MDQLSLARIFGSRTSGRQFGLRVRNQLAQARFSAVGDPIFTLREEVKAAYDVVFIDSRTGLNEVAGLSIGPLSDALVICCGLNRQNVEGTRFLMEKAGLIKGHGGKPFTILVGPLPPWRDREADERIKALKAALGTEEITAVPYHSSAALTETVFVADEPRGLMTKAFEDLAPKIVDLIRDELPERHFYKNFLNPPRKLAMSAPRGPRIVAERLAKKRLWELRQVKELRGFLALFPTALTVSCLPSHNGTTLLDEDVGPVSLAAAVAAHRMGSERAFLWAEQLPVADDFVREKLAVRSTFFRWRVLGEAPGDKGVPETFLKRALWWALSKSFDAKQDEAFVRSGLKEAFYSGTAEDFVKKALSFVADWPRRLWQLSWYDLCYIIDSIFLAIDLARAEPNPSATLAADLRMKLASLLSQRPIAQRIFPFSVVNSEVPWSRLFALMAGISSPTDLTPEVRTEMEMLLEQKIIPIDPIIHLSRRDSKALWPSLLSPVFLDKVHFDLEDHGYMALGSWPELLAAAATYCIWGETRIRDVISWIALARMNYGFGWRVLLDWSLLAGLKNHGQLAELMQRDDAEIRQVEEEIDCGIYAL